MKILILGAGAVGGYIAGRLVEIGANVSLLVRSPRHEQLQRDGLKIESVLGEFAGPVASVTEDQLTADHDLIVLTCKGYDLDSAISAVKPGLSPDGVVLPILNGLGHIDILNDAFGADRILGGTIRISVTRLADGTIKHMNDWHWLRYGEQGGGTSDRVAAIEAAFAGAPGLSVKASDDILQEMWEKFVHLSSAAGMTCLMRAPIGHIVASDEGAALAQRFLEASANVAEHNGHRPSDEFMSEFREMFADENSLYGTSMLRDIEAGNRTEGEQVLGLLLAKARAAGIDEPLFEAAYAHLRAYEARLSAG